MAIQCGQSVILLSDGDNSQFILVHIYIYIYMYINTYIHTYIHISLIRRSFIYFIRKCSTHCHVH